MIRFSFELLLHHETQDAEGPPLISLHLLIILSLLSLLGVNSSSLSFFPLSFRYSCMTTKMMMMIIFMCVCWEERSIFPSLVLLFFPVVSVEYHPSLNLLDPCATRKILPRQRVRQRHNTQDSGGRLFYCFFLYSFGIFMIHFTVTIMI